MTGFYRRLDDDLFESTPATAGPWSPGAQHGGPVTALLGRALERCAPAPDLRVARVTAEILGPVPVAPLRVGARVVRPGRRVQWLEGEVSAAGRVVMRGSAWRIARSPAHTPDIDHGPPPAPIPAAQSRFEGFADRSGLHTDGYLSAVEWRFVSGHFETRGPGEVWARPRLPLVEGEPDTPLTRALLLADSGSGVGSQLDLRKWLIINTDLTVALPRDPHGEWISMRAQVSTTPGGAGLAETWLGDQAGEFGRALSTMLVDAHP